MKLQNHKEFQTIRLFAILAIMTVMVVLLFKVVLFAPQNQESVRLPAQNVNSLDFDVLKSSNLLNK